MSNFKGKKYLKRSASSLVACGLILSMIPASYAANDVPDQSLESSDTNSNSKPEEVVSLRTAYSKTYDNNNGTYTSEMSPTPIHYNDDGEWKDIKNDLTVNEQKGTIKNQDNSFDVQLSTEKSSNQPLLKVADNKYEVSMDPISSSKENTSDNTTSSEAKVSDNRVTYNGYFTNTDIQYVLQNDRVKENILLDKKPDVKPVYTYKVNLENLTYKKGEDGLIYLMDASTNKAKFYIDRPFMHDSYVPDGFKAQPGITSIPEEAMSYDVEMNPRQEGSTLYIDIVPNYEWLQDSTRVYPVTVDPTIVNIQDGSKVEDTNLRSGLPTTTGGNDLDLGTGLYNTNIIRSLLKFDLSSIPNSTTILSAQLNTWMSVASNDTPISIGLYQATTDWIENQASWNYAKQVPSTGWNTKGGDFNTTALSIVRNIGPLQSLDHSIKWDVPTEVITNWRDNPSQNFGFMLKSLNEGTNTYKKFISSEGTNGDQYHPLLSVTYKTNARMGLEDYWTYETYSIANGTGNVNIGTGNAVLQFKDIEEKTTSKLDLSFERTFNSKSIDKSPLGYGWSFRGDSSLIDFKSYVIYTDEDGTNHNFTYDNSTSSYTSPLGDYLNLKKLPDSSFELRNKYGVIKKFKIVKVDKGTNLEIYKVVTETNPYGSSITYNYDTAGNIIKMSDKQNKEINFQYNNQGQINSIMSDSKRVTYLYDQYGYLSEVRYYKNSTQDSSVKFSYDSSHQLTSVVDGDERETTLSYKNGNIENITQPDIDDSTAVNQYKFDLPNHKSTVYDPNKDATTTYYLNEEYVASKVEDTNGININYKFDKNYNPIEEVDKDSNGNSTTIVYTYDNQGNMKKRSDGSGDILFDYDEYSNIITQTNNEGITKFYYDSQGNKFSTTYPDGTNQEEKIDIYKNLIKTITDPLGNQEVSILNSAGDLISFRDGNGNLTQYEHDDYHHITKVIDAQENENNYFYDKKGNKTKIIDANGNSTSLTYNDDANIISKKSALGNVTLYDYNDQGVVSKTITPKKDTFEYAYSDEGQLTRSSVNNNIRWDYTYNSSGNLETVKDYKNTNNSKTYKYYNNNLIQNISTQDESLDYSYDGNGNISSLISSANGNENITSYKYNNYNQILSLSNSDGLLSTYNYNSKNVLDNIVLKDNTVHSYQYDLSGNITSLKIKRNDKSLFDFTYAYDKFKNVILEQTLDGTKRFTYDSLNRLVSAENPDGTTITYSYDKNGNRISEVVKTPEADFTKKYFYNEDNELISINDKPYSYDENGNLIQDENYLYTYDSYNQLIEVRDTNNTLVVKYDYDELGRRISSDNNKGKTYYHYDGNNLLYETDAKNNVIISYIWEGSLSPVAMKTGNKTYFYQKDKYGNIIGLTDENGVFVAKYQYDTFGNIITQSGELASINPFRYSGYRYDENTGLYYLNARYYQPKWGRFITSDTFKGEEFDPTTQNSYIYANNNPNTYLDLDGHKSIKRRFTEELKAYCRRQLRAASYGMQAIGWTIGGQLLRHSLVDHPSEVYYYSGSTAVSKIKKSSDYKNKIKSLMKNNNKKGSFNYNGVLNFNTNKDLMVAFHGTEALISGAKFGNTWYISTHIFDTYDFKYEVSRFGTLVRWGNNAAAISQAVKYIVPFNIYVYFTQIIE
ncbi:DNRLRE domain-containing protein [Priestia koreensis]|uniref:RHS repeat-associated core domain-containing protein n=1 Tax=Priestia koreensis TaxID=284581 RepID=A0A0M0KPK5_9BACI|nr:DNRLRE domain-containing protein [Priestia koreensis]KOO40323.1 hypothetical protein AMD01_21475 [Priestia koreensis]